MNEFFNDEIDRNFNAKKAFKPAVNVIETAGAFDLEVVAPGYKKEDFKLRLEKDLLTISSEMKKETEAKEGEKVIRKEYRSNSFSRSFTLPENVDAETISAVYNEGILKIMIPKLEEVKEEGTREIAIG
ncbi:MAG: Hsp20/alpha crystallin family protein [Bacteroidia bacterium]